MKNLRKSLILYSIKRNLATTRISGQRASLHNAGTVGILAEIDSKEKLEQLVHLKKTIESYGPQVLGFGYAPFKMIPDYFNTQMQFEVFSKRDVNFLGRPGGSKVRDFLERQFDILMDLTTHECLPLSYLAGMAKAKIKAGRYHDEMIHVYDFMIRANDYNDFGDFLFTMKNYLSKINTSTE